MDKMRKVFYIFSLILIIIYIGYIFVNKNGDVYSLKEIFITPKLFVVDSLVGRGDILFVGGSYVDKDSNGDDRTTLFTCNLSGNGICESSFKNGEVWKIEQESNRLYLLVNSVGKNGDLDSSIYEEGLPAGGWSKINIKNPSLRGIKHFEGKLRYGWSLNGIYVIDNKSNIWNKIYSGEIFNRSTDSFFVNKEGDLIFYDLDKVVRLHVNGDINYYKFNDNSLVYGIANTDSNYILAAVKENNGSIKIVKLVNFTHEEYVANINNGIIRKFIYAYGELYVFTTEKQGSKINHYIYI